ncbi:DUF2127 domain-containing protein [Granulicella sp. 5B5]|nr:DUF2127 domain-containing protein [Granulicella sp. 5B5]
MGCEMTVKDELARLGSREDHAQGLLLVGLFKLTKFVFFAAVGVGALHLIHKNLGDEVLRLTEALRLGPESHVASFLMDKADLIDHHQLRQASLFAFLYSALCLIEGIGLMMRRVWAEYFTVTLTVLGLPWEAFELVKRASWLKVGVMAVNVVVLLYLLWVLKRKREFEGQVNVAGQANLRG